MSDSLNLEKLRKEAKNILKLCRAGDRNTIDRMRRQLPRLGTVNNEQLASQIKLSDVQHALSRELGYLNWAELKRHDLPLARFLTAIRGGALDAAQDELRHSPKLANDSIHVACAVGDADAVRHHLNADASLLTSEQGGWPPLLYACASPYHRLSLRHAFSIHECASLLLDHGADPNTYTLTEPSDPNSRMPAIARAGMNNNRMLFLLLSQRGATPDLSAMKATLARTDLSQNPLSHAYLNLAEDPAFRQELNRRLAPILAGRRMPPSLSQMSMKAMLDFGHDEDRTFRDSNLVLWQLAIERGIDPNWRSGPNAETPLHRLALRNDAVGKGLAELFLIKGADPNVAAADGRTPYSIAVRMGNEAMMDVLLQHGAQSKSASSVDQFIGACRRRDERTAWSLLRADPTLSESIGRECDELLLNAVKNNQLDGVRLMANLGFALAATRHRDATPLHIAAWHGYVEMVRLLLEFHTAVNCRDPVYGTSPLAWAAHGSKASKRLREGHDADYCAVVAALIDAGADYESACNSWGTGPEQVASEPVVDLLKARGFVPRR